MVGCEEQQHGRRESCRIVNLYMLFTRRVCDVTTSGKKMLKTFWALFNITLKHAQMVGCEEQQHGRRESCFP
jgi:hypothetical protein